MTANIKHFYRGSIILIYKTQETTFPVQSEVTFEILYKVAISVLWL